jgi:hypothetical protein
MVQVTDFASGSPQLPQGSSKAYSQSHRFRFRPAAAAARLIQGACSKSRIPLQARHSCRNAHPRHLGKVTDFASGSPQLSQCSSKAPGQSHGFHFRLAAAVAMLIQGTWSKSRISLQARRSCRNAHPRHLVKVTDFASGSPQLSHRSSKASSPNRCCGLGPASSSLLARVNPKAPGPNRCCGLGPESAHRCQLVSTQRHRC